MTILKEFLQPNLVTAIYCTPEDLYDKFLFTKIFPMDIPNKEDQGTIIEQTHNRAHRGFDENIKQISSFDYWPKMHKQFKEYIRNCEICNKNKYERQPIKIPIGEVPIPKEKGIQIHIDIFYAQSLKFITCIDSYSKFLVIKQIEDKINLEDKVLDILQSFPNVKRITIDNEPGFTTVQFKSLMQRLQIEIFFCNQNQSTTD